MGFITISAYVKKELSKRGKKLKQLEVGQIAEVRIKNGRITTDKKITPIKIEVISWDYTQYDKCLRCFIYINLKLKKL